jgi:hypothetical protein
MLASESGIEIMNLPPGRSRSVVTQSASGSRPR